MIRFKHLTASGSLMAVIASGLLGGCTQPVEVDAETKMTSTAKNLPFAYDTVIDQVAHMSCSNMTSSNYNKSAYFSYRAGAYTNGGILLKDSFFETLKNKKPEFMSEVLTTSPANTNTVVQMALRSKANYQALYSASGSAVLDQDYANMMTELGVEDVSDTLIALPVGARLRHIRTGSVGGARMEGSLYFTASQNLSQGSRDFVQGRGGTSTNTGLLAITYTNGSETSARSIADQNEKSGTTNLRSVYGRGYSMTFAKPSVSGINAAYPENVISLVQEQSLDSSSPVSSGTWTCPAGFQFRIVRFEDVNKSGANCRKVADPELISPELRLVRNTLRAEDWYVDMTNRCIIPKKPSGENGCYGKVTDIRYNLGDACGADSANPTQSNCTQFASICYRTN